MCCENAIAMARIRLKAKAKWRCGVSNLAIAKTSSLTAGPREELLRANLKGLPKGSFDEHC